MSQDMVAAELFADAAIDDANDLQSQAQVAAELMGKEFIYTRMILLRVLVASLCTNKLVELESGCG